MRAGHRRADRGLLPAERRRIRQAVLARWGLVCWICNRSIATAWQATMDHVRPAKYGGTYVASNLRPAHKECNEWRGHGPPPPAP